MDIPFNENKNKPALGEKHQYIKLITVNTISVSPKEVKVKKKLSKIPPDASLIPCSQRRKSICGFINIGFVKRVLIIILVYYKNVYYVLVRKHALVLKKRITFWLSSF